jgi:ergothioneine biosynthesis protein EgtB
MAYRLLLKTARNRSRSFRGGPPLPSSTLSANPAVDGRSHDIHADGLRTRYTAVRQQTEQLARPLSPEDCQIQSMPDCSPTKWHLAHTSWFFETFVLGPYAPAHQPFDPSFNFLFNSYYNAVGNRLPRPQRGLITRPSLDDVYAYRASIDRAMQSFLDAAASSLTPEIAAVIELGLNHEQQHQELIVTDIKHALAQNPLRPAYCRAAASAPAAETRMMDWSFHPGGLEWVGHDGRGFAFDNESPRHRVYLEPFLLGSRLVTSGEFAEFIADGGYRRPELWLSDGWNTVCTENWQAPLYWEKDHDTYSIMTLCGFRRLLECEPVCHLSFYEADAYARWAGARLPTEFEWELAASDRSPTGNFLESTRFHPHASRDATGLAQLFGDVWEWTASPYSAYPGLRTASGALGEYNAKFMCNQLVLRGGSCATPASHIRSTYRNFFPPEARWQFSGIRLAKDA